MDMNAQDVATIEKSQEPDAVQVPEANNGPEWKPTLHELLILVSLAAISLMVSLDATILVTSLSVRSLPQDETISNIVADHDHRSRRHDYPGLLGWHIVPLVLRCDDAVHCRPE